MPDRKRPPCPPLPLLITGANGYLASQVIVDVLASSATARVACLVRAPTDHLASEKLFAALDATAAHAGQPPLDAAARARIVVVRGDLDDMGWVARVGGDLGARYDVIHCAASLSFLDSDRAQVLHTNLGGTTRLLAALAGDGRHDQTMASFNYVSTAYVAGRRTGCIHEDIASARPAFNNAYEESKSLAEAAVTATCSARAIAYRIFRPSIIIGHSKTYRSYSDSGFYKVLDRLAAFAEMGGTGQRIGVTLPREATLDLIPVDIVSAEMRLLIGAPVSDTDCIFHITSEHTTTLFDFARLISPIIGVSLDPSQGDSGDASFELRILNRLLSNYASYFTSEKHFDRSNVRAAGADRMQKAYRLDLSRLARFVTTYLDARRATAETMPTRDRPTRARRAALVAAPVPMPVPMPVSAFAPAPALTTIGI